MSKTSPFGEFTSTNSIRSGKALWSVLGKKTGIGPVTSSFGGCGVQEVSQWYGHMKLALKSRSDFLKPTQRGKEGTFWNAEETWWTEAGVARIWQAQGTANSLMGTEIASILLGAVVPLSLIHQGALGEWPRPGQSGACLLYIALTSSHCQRTFDDLKGKPLCHVWLPVIARVCGHGARDTVGGEGCPEGVALRGRMEPERFMCCSLRITIQRFKASSEMF